MSTRSVTEPAGGSKASRPLAAFGVPSRRAVFRLGLAGTAALLCLGHTPYRQWVKYRQQHLLIMSDKTDPPSFPLSLAVAATLLEHLPDSQAQASRAVDLHRLVSLLTTGQIEVALMRPADAVALAADAPPMAGYRPVVLRVLAALGEHLLVCRADFPDHHAYLVTATIEENRGEIHDQVAELKDPVAIPETVPLHAGARAYRDGQPLPDLLEDQPAPSDAAD